MHDRQTGKGNARNVGTAILVFVKFELSQNWTKTNTTKVAFVGNKFCSRFIFLANHGMAKLFRNSV